MSVVQSEGININNILSAVQYGIVQGNVMESLGELMASVFMPMCGANGSWPSSIKKDFTGFLHKFQAQLVETTNGIQGRTVLYIPKENITDKEVTNNYGRGS